MIETLKNAFRNKDIRKKIFLTLLILVMRSPSHMTRTEPAV